MISDEENSDNETNVKVKREQNGVDSTSSSQDEKKTTDAKNKNSNSEIVKTEDSSLLDKDDSPPVLESEGTARESQGNPTWSFIDTPELLDALLECLNARGYRECSLKASLLELKPLLSKSIRNCPTDMLSLPEDGGEEKARIQVSNFAIIIKISMSI